MYKIPAKTLFIGKNLIFLPSCHSTNEVAADLIEKKGIVEGTTVITDHQTAGKGQRGNLWLTQPHKNLTFSIILKPSFLSIVHQFHLNITISLGILDYLNSITKNFQVKWPNDIYFNDRKICGILISNQVKGKIIENAIVGIGLNVNQKDFPDEKPVSLSLILEQEYSLNEVFNDLMGFLEARYMQLRRGETNQLKMDYLHHLYWYGEDHLFKAGEDVFHGRITGISEYGLLEVDTKNGVNAFNFKEIEFLS